MPVNVERGTDEQLTPTAAVADAWAQRSNEELIGYIFDRFHVPLMPELRRLDALAAKVARVHRDKEPQRLLAIAETITALMHDMEHHLEEEESVIFPWVLSGGSGAEGRMKAVGHDHRSHGWALAELRRLTRNFQVPEEACTSWRALWAGLEQLEKDLTEHIRLEEKVLFPRLLAR